MASPALEKFSSAVKISESSAYWIISVLGLQYLVIPLTYKKKRWGPSFVPWGTPCLTLRQSDLVPLTHARWILLVSKPLLNEMTFMLTLMCSRYSHIIVWEMESKVSDKLSAAHTVYKLILMLYLFSSLSYSKVFLVERVLRKPNWRNYSVFFQSR